MDKEKGKELIIELPEYYYKQLRELVQLEGSDMQTVIIRIIEQELKLQNGEHVTPEGIESISGYSDCPQECSTCFHKNQDAVESKNAEDPIKCDGCGNWIVEGVVYYNVEKCCLTFCQTCYNIEQEGEV